jgi:hypothetical protein
MDANDIYEALLMLQRAVAFEFELVNERLRVIERSLSRRIERLEDRIDEVRRREDRP